MNTTKKILSTLLLMLACVAANAQTQQVEKFNVKVGDFSHLYLMDNIDVVYIQDAAKAGTVTFTATKRMANCIIFTNNGKGKLKIEVQEDLIGNAKTPVLTIYSSNLTDVENAADSTLTVKSLEVGERFGVNSTANGNVVLKKVDVGELSLSSFTGKGYIKASGKCKKLYARVLGKGIIYAEDLVADEIACRSTGNGLIQVNINGGELNVKGSGNGKVLYRGNPGKIVTHKLLGSLKVEPMEK